MLKFTSIVVTLLLTLVTCAAACNTDMDCSLNGKCSAGACVCSKGWHGVECELLSLAPAPPGGAYGFSPNISSWGAHVVRVKSDDLFHMYVSELWGGCGISESWRQNSHVIHATAQTALGPYVYEDTSLPPEATCNHVLVVENGTRIVQYHQGRSGGGKGRLVKCDNTTMPNETWAPVQQHKIHESFSPAGPWTVGKGTMPAGIICNNPAPLLLKNGSVAMFCHGPGIRLALAPSYDAPFGSATFISQEGSYPIPHTVWEDPFGYLDSEGNWHLLAHVYPTNTSNWMQYAEIVAGHAFSRDGVEWRFHPTPPWTADVTNVDGSKRHYGLRDS